MRRLLCFALLVAAAGAPAAQVGFGLFNGRTHPEFDWQVAETEHFEIVYPAHLAGIEAEAAAVAEATFDVLSRTFAPDSTAPLAFDRKLRIYLSDEDEIANGIAFDVGSAGFTTIWVHVNETAEIWTGDVKWLRKVVAHEVAHLLHYRAVAGSFGALDLVLADPFPSFWAEGLAQYATERWDAQRGDRWLRTATFEDRLNYSDGTSPQNGRLRYAVGNSQVRYLAESRGDSTIAQILAHRRPALLGLGRVHDFRTAFRAVTGDSYGTFNEEWRKHVNVYYNTQAGQMERLDSLDAEPFGLPGQVVYDVAFSPDTARVAAVVLPSLARPVRRLIVMTNPGADSTRRDLRILAEGAITGPIAWAPDGAHLAYARTRRGANGSLVNDLYRVDLASGRRERLTTDRRAVSPSFSPDGRTLAFVASDGPTANLFALDLDTRTERPLTAFTGDVQIPTARWSPDGARVAFSLFDADGTRHLATLDLASGAVDRLGTGADVPRAERDDRLPVWSPDGDALAFTSLRDRAPNAFVVGERGSATGDRGVTAADSAGADSTGGLRPDGRPPMAAPRERSEQRVTFLYDGATVHDWLPPDSLHPAGRLVLVATETKRRDRVFVVDARRRPTVAAGSVVVPPAYAAWTAHRPALTVPDAIAPDPGLIRERRPYSALANLTHVVTIALPYGDPGEDNALFTDDDDWGVFANSLLIEPLGKHQLAVLAGVSLTRPVDKSFAIVSYTNRQTAAEVTLDLYRYPSPSRIYGTRVLAEDLTGGDLSAALPLDVLDRPYTTTALGARVRYAYAEPIALERFVDVAAEGLGVPEAGTRFDLEAGAVYKFQRPYRWNVLAPLDGTGLRARLGVGVPALGGDAFLRPDVLGYRIWRLPGRSRLFTKARATAIFGETLAQDYVGLARFDAVEAVVPFAGELGVASAERVRGYRSYAVGTRVAFASAELRSPPLADLNTRLLGLVELGALSASAFADAGVVWTGADLDGGIQRLGVGAELVNVLSLAGLEIRHALGLAAPAADLGDLWDAAGDGSLRLGDLDLYYRLQAAVPF